MKHKLEIRNSVRDETAQKVLGHVPVCGSVGRRVRCTKYQNCHVNAALYLLYLEPKCIEMDAR